MANGFHWAQTGPLGEQWLNFIVQIGFIFVLAGGNLVLGDTDLPNDLQYLVSPVLFQNIIPEALGVQGSALTANEEQFGPVEVEFLNWS